MIAYRYKTPHRASASPRRGDDVVSPSQFFFGLIVWVEGENGREERFCSAQHGKLLTPEEYYSFKATRAANRRVSYPGGRRKSPNIPVHHYAFA